MEFKFSLGDIVYTKSAVADAELQMVAGFVLFPNALQVVERLRQECPGGVQLHYKLKGRNGEGGQTLFLEQELICKKEYSPVDNVEAYLAARKRNDSWKPE